eukprot:5780547-Amphidinium_carterae.3
MSSQPWYWQHGQGFLSVTCQVGLGATGLAMMLFLYKHVMIDASARFHAGTRSYHWALQQMAAGTMDRLIPIACSSCKSGQNRLGRQEGVVTKEVQKGFLIGIHGLLLLGLGTGSVCSLSP